MSGLRLKGKKLTCQDEHDEGHNGTPLPDPARVLRLLVRHLRCFPCVCRARTGEAPRLVSRRQSAKGAAQSWGLGVKCVVNRQRRASSAVGGGGTFFSLHTKSRATEDRPGGVGVGGRLRLADDEMLSAAAAAKQDKGDPVFFVSAQRASVRPGGRACALVWRNDWKRDAGKSHCCWCCCRTSAWLFNGA